MTVVAVADTGPLIHLGEIDSLSLLSLLEELYVPETVLEELAVGDLPSGLDDLEYTPVEASEERSTTDDLDPGERAAIAVSQEQNAVLLTDDLAARDRATDQGIEVHGSIGIVALGYASGRLDRDEAASRMRRLQSESSLFVSEAVVERGIEMLDDA